MSLDINWDRLLAAEPELSQQTISFLNTYIADRLPQFLQYLRITRLSFGSHPPTVQLVDISQPLDAFYAVQGPSRANSPVATAYSSAVNSERSAGLDAEDEIQTVPPFLRQQPQRQYYRNPLDTQLAVRIEYDGQEGDIEMWLETELQLNIPSPSFISLPVQLRMSHLRFNGTLLLAYLAHNNSLSFAFRHHTPPSEIKKSKYFDGTVEGETGEEPTGVHVDMRIESELGDSGKQVMKNVAKIERFLVDLIRRLVTEDLAYPNCRSIRLSRNHGDNPWMGSRGFPTESAAAGYADGDLYFGQSAFSDYEID